MAFGNRRLAVGILSWCVATAAPWAAAQASSNELTSEEIREGWVLLFDGSTLFGWKPASKADWRVADGAIVAADGEPGLLATTSQFGDFAMKLEFRGGPETNSGVFLRTPPKVARQDVAAKCYEVNIAADDNPFPTGSLVGRKRAEPVAAGAQWRRLQVTAEGGRFLVEIDGKKALDYHDPQPVARGHVGLQFNRGKIEFRGIKLKPLATRSLFDGKDLGGWKVYPACHASVTSEGWIHLVGGKGQLESVGQFADFTLQLEVFVNGRGINSGVFFRSIPGEMWNGYESQIHNVFLNGDRAKPADCGSGGIFRRQNARKVVANDKEWFAKTIHADGSHMTVWVNGYQVSDWTDPRPPAENPRKGLRVKAGTIILQGHDPTSDFFFRNLRIAELKPSEGAAAK